MTQCKGHGCASCLGLAHDNVCLSRRVSQAALGPVSSITWHDEEHAACMNSAGSRGRELQGCANHDLIAAGGASEPLL